MPPNFALLLTFFSRSFDALFTTLLFSLILSVRLSHYSTVGHRAIDTHTKTYRDMDGHSGERIDRWMNRFVCGWNMYG